MLLESIIPVMIFSISPFICTESTNHTGYKVSNADDGRYVKYSPLVSPNVPTRPRSELGRVYEINKEENVGRETKKGERERESKTKIKDEKV